MSKIVFICPRHQETLSFSKDDIESIAQRITPDNILPQATEIVESDGMLYGLTNPMQTVKRHGISVLMGQDFNNSEDWWEIGGEPPEGTYAIFRADSVTVELITDAVASRTIWYYFDEEVLIASTSQRALVMLAKTFVFNEDVIAWMLSTGSLGPSQSWDKRIRMVPPDSVINLNRTTWHLEIHSRPVKFCSEDIPDTKHKIELRNSLADTFKGLKIDFNKWVLPLSGGFDSRSILCFLASTGEDLRQLKSITWGMKESPKQKGNDAYVAQKIASYYKTKHKFYLTNASDEPIVKIFERFLVCGEGRIDHISGYMDGFKIWKTLFEDKVQGIIRGDEGFGWVTVKSPTDVRHRIGISLCSDFSNLKEFVRPDHNLPDILQKTEDETLETWRDRLYHQFRIPIILAALNDLKLPYVEVINPLLSHRIIDTSRKGPDHLRTNKALFKKIVRTISPDIAYATSGANAETVFLLRTKQAVELFKYELTTDYCKSLFSEKLIMHILENLTVNEGLVNRKQGFKSLLKRYLPQELLRRFSRFRVGSAIDVNILAFRVFMISKMKKVMEEDSNLLREIRSL
ncbi:hypothetical protein GZH53_10870 [Flavihumibacter sp. R14]|nr:hypothetical protein [Flavihumibacter soli]